MFPIQIQTLLSIYIDFKLDFGICILTKQFFLLPQFYIWFCDICLQTQNVDLNLVPLISSLPPLIAKSGAAPSHAARCGPGGHVQPPAGRRADRVPRQQPRRWLCGRRPRPCARPSLGLTQLPPLLPLGFVSRGMRRICRPRRTFWCSRAAALLG